MALAKTLCATIISSLWPVFILVGYSAGELLLQDVLWTKQYDDGFDENYFGKCRFVQSPCSILGHYDGKSGVCTKRGQCEQLGGLLQGPCDDENVGECCEFLEMCNQTNNKVNVNQLVTVLESSPDSPHLSECAFRFPKEPNICQIRLDFVSFLSQGANIEGECDTDKLRITNSITLQNDFTTCGDLTGQHMYLSFGNRDIIEVHPTIRSARGYYKIIATRIPCSSKSRVPDHCLQHFTQPSGVVKSFDYAGQQQNNQRYTVCVKPISESTEVHWKPCSSSGKSFDIMSNSAAPLPVTGDMCTADWVQVKGMARQCEFFPYLIKGSWKPYELLVNFDESELPPPPAGYTPIPPPPGQTCAEFCVSIGAMLPDYTCACNMNMECQCYADTAILPPPDGTPYSTPGYELHLPPPFSASGVPETCEESCRSPPGFECACVGPLNEKFCQCVDSGSYVVPPVMDVNNAGFCLEYMQQ